MTNHLESTPRGTISVRVKRRPKVWTVERRARQAALIRGWQPWRRSTGPRTETGKERSATNALKHGFRSRANILQLQRVRHAIRLCAYTVASVRAHMRGLSLPPKPLLRADHAPRDIPVGIMQADQGLWYCPGSQKAARIDGF